MRNFGPLTHPSGPPPFGPPPFGAPPLQAPTPSGPPPSGPLVPHLRAPTRLLSLKKAKKLTMAKVGLAVAKVGLAKAGRGQSRSRPPSQESF